MIRGWAQRMASCFVIRLSKLSSNANRNQTTLSKNNEAWSTTRPYNYTSACNKVCLLFCSKLEPRVSFHVASPPLQYLHVQCFLFSCYWNNAAPCVSATMHQLRKTMVHERAQRIASCFVIRLSLFRAEAFRTCCFASACLRCCADLRGTMFWRRSMDLAIALLIILPDPNEIVRTRNAFPTDCEIYRHMCEAHVSNLLAWVQ